MRKKIFVMFMIVILSFTLISINTKAYEVNGVEYSYFTRELYNTSNDENYYDIIFYLENGASDVALKTSNQTSWYSIFDNVNAIPHFYNLGKPIILTYQGVSAYDGIYGVLIDYDVGGASSSTIYLFDNYNGLIGTLLMSDLDGDFEFIMITSAILDPYAQGYADGSRETAINKDNYYLPQIASLENQIINTETLAYNDGYIDGYQQGEIDGYADGEEDTASNIFNNGFDSYGMNNTLSYPYGVGFSAGELSDFNGFVVLINAFLQTFQVLTIEIMPGITLGAIAFIPLMLGLITFAIGLATASFSGNQYSKGKQKGSKR